jgi:transposase
METPYPTYHDWREWRRLRAVDLKEQGRTQREIAMVLGVTEGAVSQWLAAERAGRREALFARPRPGARPKLAPEQLRLLPDLLWHGPESYGFPGEIWTCDRVAGVLWEEFDVWYSRSQVSRLLNRLHRTPPVPITRAIQRDEEAIERWRVESWPALRKKARRERRAPVLVAESGFYLLPGVVKTYGPEGRTPIISEWQTRDHLSVMGGVTSQGKVYAPVRPTSSSGLHRVEFLMHLGRSASDRLLVIWDGSPIHRRAWVREFVEEAGGKIHLESLPAYAPDLNPVEWLWRHLKLVEMANRTCLDLEQLHEELHLALGRLREKRRLIPSFFEGAGLAL